MGRISVLLFTFFISATCLVNAKPREAIIATEFFINTDENSASLTFGRLVYSVPGSGVVGKIKFGAFCVNQRDFVIDQSTFEIDSRMYINTFTEVLRGANYNIAGDPNALFADEKAEAEYIVSGLITEYEYDMCYMEDFMKNLKTGGANYMKVEWQVYNVRDQKIIYKNSTEGYGIIKKLQKDGHIITLKNSFTGAVHNLLADKSFHDLFLSTVNLEISDPEFDGIYVNYVPVSESTLSRGLDTLAESVVGIKAGMGTGSGFIISSNGYILSNHHVIEGNDTVTVVFENGMEVEGQVIRSAPTRDVALIKVPLSNLKPLSLNKKEPKIGSKSYAMGSPKGLENHGTLSSGIISAMRNFEDGYNLIQSDTNVTNGNSGGPMLNEDGQVIAITVSGSRKVDFANYFIPIESALETLGIQRPEGSD